MLHINISSRTGLRLQIIFMWQTTAWIVVNCLASFLVKTNFYQPSDNFFLARTIKQCSPRLVLFCPLLPLKHIQILMWIKISSKYNPGCNLLVDTPKLATHMQGEGRGHNRAVFFNMTSCQLSCRQVPSRKVVFGRKVGWHSITTSRRRCLQQC